MMIKIILMLTLILGVNFSQDGKQNIPLNVKTELIRILRRCYSCRSRGDLGSCKDPFKINSTLVEKEKGVEAIPCASGWCAKIIEGGQNDDYGVATERQCLQRGPSDSEERCAKTEWNHKKVYMCFCQGDLCNSSNTVEFNYLSFIALIPIFQFIVPIWIVN